MKTAFLLVILCAFAFSGYAASEPEYSAVKVKELIASLPTVAERKTPSDPNIDTKTRGADARFKELFFQLKIGKSIFDYPGILPLGTLRWNAERGVFIFHVAGGGESFGFDCIFPVSGKIADKRGYMAAL